MFLGRDTGNQMNRYYKYKQILEQVGIPNGVQSISIVVWTKQQAEESIGKLHNPSWRITGMELVEDEPVFSIGKDAK